MCIHHQANPTIDLQTPHELQHVMKKTINIHVDTYSIKPTPTHYHIKFSNAWKNAPKTDIPPINTITTSLPTKYNHIHSLIFHLQHCTYTNGSFIPPTKNPEGQNSRQHHKNRGLQSQQRHPTIKEIPKHPKNILVLGYVRVCLGYVISRYLTLSKPYKLSNKTCIYLHIALTTYS